MEYFNPRSPQGERRLAKWTNDYNRKFQSTLPAGGATKVDDAIIPIGVDFNPRSPQGERHTLIQQMMAFCFISIHAPRRGSDHGLA